MPDFGLKELAAGIKASKAVRPVGEAIEKVKPPKPPVEKPPVDVLEPVSPVPAIQEPPANPVRPTLPVEQVDPEARRISSLNLGDYDLNEIHQTNFDMIKTTDDIKAVIADSAERNVGKIDEARRGEITHEQLGKLAGELNTSEDVVKAVLERQSGGTLSPEVILASRLVLNASADRLKTLAQKITTGQATDIERLQFRRQMMFHDEYQAAFMGARAETGRALNAFGIPVGDNPQQLSALKQTVETMYGKDTDELATMISQIDNIEGIGKLTREYTRSKIAGTVQEVFINSILSGFRTQEVNTIGNVLFQVMNVAETATAAQMGQMLPGKSHVRPGEAFALAYGAITGWRDALKLAKQSFKEGRSLDDIAKYEGNLSRRAISAKNYEITDPSLGAAVDALGALIRLPTERGLAPMDEFSKAVSYRAELSRVAYRNAMAQAELQGLPPAETSKLITQFMDNPPSTVVQMGEDWAHYVTFQQPLGVIGNDIKKALQNTPGAFFITPFIKTPVNIFKAGLLERSPLAIFSKQFREALDKGGPERDLAVARVAIGTLTTASIAVAVRSGAVTGGGPPDPDARKVLLATGWQPYSFRVEDEAGNVTYQSYARAEPLAYVIGATADAAEIVAAIGEDGNDDLKTEQEHVENMIAAITAGVANNSMSKTFMSGVADFSEALSDPKRYMSGYLQNMAASTIPYSAFRRQFAQLQDPLLREAWTFSEKLKVNSGIPGWSENAPPKRDIFGKPVERPSGAILGTSSVFPDSEESIDPVLREIVKVMTDTGTVPIAMPSKRIEGMKLNSVEYDQLVRISRTEPVLGGRTLHEALDDLYASNPYNDATPDMKAILMRNLQQKADEVGRVRLEQENPSFATRLETHRYKKRSVMFGTDEPVLNLAK